METDWIILDGHSLTMEQCMDLGSGKYTIKLSDAAWLCVEKARAVVEKIVAEGQVVYGINTGFGNFSNVTIARENLDLLQTNLVRSHAAGVGDAMTLEATRRLMAARINVLAKGYSGISRETLQQVIDAFNVGCLPLVPKQGTLGASGDLAQLAHLSLGLIGLMWNPKTKEYGDAKEVLAENGLKPLTLQAKEGLALINGTQFISSLGTEALSRAITAAKTADYICALTVEALKGTINAFFPIIHEARPHPGQLYSAANIRACIHSDQFPSEIYLQKTTHQVQDAYSLRCAPQVHGIAHDTLNFVKMILETEINSATDNPMVIFGQAGKPGWIVSGGNFHGEYPSKALDYLAIGTAELASISERRTDRLMNSHLSELPEFLVPDGGLNSGFMIAHCTAAALVSENKGLCHPASVDSIPTSAQKEDHVSMGGWAARKALKVVENVEVVLAVELLAACQAIDLQAPRKTTKPLEALHARVRELVPFWDKDRFMKPDIDKITELVRSGEVITIVETVLKQYHEDSKMGTSLERMIKPVVYQGGLPGAKIHHTHGGATYTPSSSVRAPGQSITSASTKWAEVLMAAALGLSVGVTVGLLFSKNK